MSEIVERIDIRDGDDYPKDKGSFSGSIECFVRTINKNTREVIKEECMFKKNLLVYLGLEHLAHLLVGSRTDYLTQMAVGLGDTAPDPNDSGLESEVYRTVFSSIDYPTAGRVRVSATFLDSTLNSMLNEAGTFMSNGVMLSRIKFPTVINLIYDPESLIGKELELRWTYAYV